MEKVKDKYMEEIAEIPEKVAISDDSDSIQTNTSGSLPVGDGLIIDAGAKTEFITPQKKSETDTVNKAGGLKNLSAEFRDKIKKSVPSDFDFSQIGKIDLKEAEKIANEEIIFLKEDDLIVGLEDFELIPLKNIPDSWKEEPVIPELPGLPVITTRKREPEPQPDMAESGEDLLFEDFSATDNETEKHLTEEKVEEQETVSEEIPPVDLLVDEKEYKVDKLYITEEQPEFSEVTESTILKASDSVIQESDDDIKQTVSKDVIDSQISEAVKDNYIIEDETLPQKYAELAKKNNVMFIDDGHISKNNDKSIITINDSLTSRLSKIIELSKGKFKIIENENNLLQNSYTIEDHGIYNYTDDSFYEERLINDTDFEYIDNSIIKEDFIQYIHEIDDYYYNTERADSSEIAEIMGLSKDEAEAFEDILFGDYFKDIDIDSGIEFINPNLDFFNRSMPDKKNLVYILDDPESLKFEERKSIEDDVSSENAIIFEEDVKEIAILLGESHEQAIPSDQKILLQKEMDGVPEVVIIEDITDRVIILEDKFNMEQFMETIPDKKEDLAKLLAYLDGLFEKLPEEAVRKFADSEYFDLYVKVMKEMGI